MHSVLWASIGFSAVVAVVTTLLVEYLAKPGLEARKDRILEGRREKRKGINALGRAAFYAGRLSVYHEDSNLDSAPDEYIDEIAKDLRENVITAYESIDIQEVIKDDWDEAMAILQAF